MRSRAHIIANLCIALLLGTFVALAGCSDTTAPRMETLASFGLSAPTPIAAGEMVTLAIEAVGTQGTRPFLEFNGEVTLAASLGSITPDVVTMTDGRATVDVTLSASEGVVQVSASGASAAGVIAIDVSALTALPGDSSDDASASIPDLEYAPAVSDFDSGHPDLAGFSVSLNTVLVSFAASATVEDANVVIANVGGVIVGGISGTAGTGGMLMLRVSTNTHAEMDAMIAALEAEGAIESATPDQLNDLTFVPNSGNQLAAWTWGKTPGDGNWGMEMCRMPQMWNLNSAIAKRGDPSILTGIVDGGFGEHNDLALRRVGGGNVDDHGTHVGGTIAAGFNNERGVDGVSPFAVLRVYAPFILTNGTITQGVVALAYDGSRVINMSLGTAWSAHPDDSPVARFFLERSAKQMMDAFEPLRDSGQMPLLVSSAGNESDDFANPVQARHGGPVNYAALELGFGDIIVVEAIEEEGDGRRLHMSNLNGHVSAPGGDVLSTLANNGFGLASGTSMAAPHVTGLASFLLSIDPSLTNAELISLITTNTQPTSPFLAFDASPRIDAFAAALAIDGLRGGDDVIRMLIDIDDGTVDGNLRVSPEDPSAAFIDEDADGDGGIGDGRIDMCDFRRWRDWLHQVDQTAGAVFDGLPNHGKRDVNGDRRADLPADEDIYPRADFNGDGSLDIAAQAVVPGESAPRTDFDMLVRHFDDPAFQEETLEQLIFSGDIHVDLSQYVSSGRFDKVVSQAATNAGDVIETREHTETEPAYVYTLEFDTVYRVTAWGISGGDTACTNSGQFEVGLCSDAYFVPECSAVVVEITMAQSIEPGADSPLLIRAGILGANGDPVYQAGIQLDISATGGSVAVTSGVTDVDGFFDTEVTMGVNSPQLNVFVTATDPITGESEVGHATALPLGDASVVLTAGDFGANAGASTRVQNQDGSSDGGFTREFFPPTTSLSAGHGASASSSDADQGWTATATASASMSGEAIMGSSGRMTGARFTGNTSASVSVSGSPGCCFASSSASVHMRLEFDVETAVLASMSSQGESGFGSVLSADGSVLIISGNGSVVLEPGSYKAFFGAAPDQSTGIGSVTATLTFSRPPASRTASR